MRALLAAINCPKGEPNTNLARHREILQQAARENCEIAVFPEMSLTGYADPEMFPSGPIKLDDPTIGKLAAETGRTGVAALFGIVERKDDGTAAITQIFAMGGEVRGTYSKRHLGEGEENFTAGTEKAAFAMPTVVIGTAICAESEVTYPFSDAKDLGAKVVFHCSAPGLYGQQDDDAGWQRGFNWWRNTSIERLTTYAKELDIWIATAGQSGTTIDENFPGWAALINPSGKIVAELPDWREATLTVDIPV